MNYTNIKKLCQQTTGLMQRLNNIKLMSIGDILRKALFSIRVFICCLQVCLAWKTISCQTDKGNRVRQTEYCHSQGPPDFEIL